MTKTYKHTIMHQLIRTSIIASAIFLLFTIPFISVGQNLTGETVKAQFIKEWQRARDYTLEYLNAMPADKYSFKPVDSIRSFAQQMLHLASANVFLITTATDKKTDWSAANLEGRPTAQGKDSVVYYVLKSYDFAIESIKSFDPSKFGEIVGTRIHETRFAYLLKGFEHQTHHRGQTTIYIRLLGIRPPAEKLF